MKLVTPYLRSPFAAFAPFAGLERELGRYLASDGAACETAVAVPATDVREDGDSFVITADLPGVAKEDLKVSLHDGVLTLSAERRQEKKTPAEGNYYRYERHQGRFERRFTLDVPVAGDAIKAAYKDGVLTVTVPKAEQAKPRQIDVAVS